MGGGTGMIGDPTDKTEMRRIMTREEIDYNVSCFKKQLSRFIDVSDGKAIVVNNADWLLELKYLPFIREYGIHFSVNKMLTADSYRTRFERGLSFFEFNYQLLQAYDFLELYRKYSCKLQMGGRDQWSNIIAGIELIRRAEDADVQGVTFSLLAKSDGTKMGKSQKGAIWLDAEKTPPYEFFQYWRNVDDPDVIRFMKLLTYLSLDEIKQYETLTGSALNKAKEVLAFEITKNVHGQREAEKALDAARTLFSGTGAGEGIPTALFPAGEISGGINVIDLLMKTSLVKSRSDARRLIEQNSIKVNGENVSGFDKIFYEADAADGAFMIQKGKKGYHRVKIEG
jgi:tyrosyl-tRNA synthetase